LQDKNYTMLHCHTMLSNGVTNIDSITKYTDYVNKAQECGMKAFAFSEHGSVFEWYHKKMALEKVGIKYIHAEEFYVTESLDVKVRDNYHCLIIATNYDGFLELNKLSSKSFNREDGSFYYTPRITFEDLINTSDNLVISTACLGGILHKGNDIIRERFIEFLTKNKHRCFLEIQPHRDPLQVEYNKYLYKLSQSNGIRLVCCTDTHALNDNHVKGRSILQKSKNIYFEGEDNFDLTFKTYDELVDACKRQNALPLDVYLEAIENTNVIADMVEPFEIDYSYKYPHLWGDDSDEYFKRKIMDGIKKRGVDKYPNYDEYIERIKYELKAYRHNQAIDFMLLMQDIIEWCETQDIRVGYGRGSCNGSVIAWLLGITEMDSIKYKLNFDRFMNIERVSLSDIDTDFPPSRVDEVKQYIFNKHGLYCADIITFNTIALKGAIRDVCRALYQPRTVSNDIKEIADIEMRGYGQISDRTSKEFDKQYNGNYLEISSYLCDNVELNEDRMREEYKEVFEYVDLVNGTIVSVGNHPCGLVVAGDSIDDRMGLFTTSTDTVMISQINMKEIDAQNYVKLDLLKLDTIELINETCKLANIDRLIPDNIDVNDDNVWKSMRDDTTQIFQWEGDTGNRYIKELFSDSTLSRFKEISGDIDMLTLLSIGNSAIRPAGESYRDELATGIVRTTGFKPLDDFLSPTFGQLCFQEQILEFLHEYCGFTMGEADIVRRGFAKKTGTEQFIPVIKDGGYLTDKDGNKLNEHYIDGFIKTMNIKYNMSNDEAEKAIGYFVQVIESASSYAFSMNHSHPYSFEGLASAWLRYYYPLEFLTVALNINRDKEEKTKGLTAYATKIGIKISSPKFGKSKAQYFLDKETNSIYKGIGSIKNLNDTISDQLYELSKSHYSNFFNLLKVIKDQTKLNSKQLDILIRLDYFSQFGHPHQLLSLVDIYSELSTLYNKFKTAKKPSKSLFEELSIPLSEVATIADKSTEKQFAISNNEALLKLFKKYYKQILAQVSAKYPYQPTTKLDKIKYEVELLGYTDLIDESVSDRYYIVTNVEATQYNTFLTIYQISTGIQYKYKVDKGWWKDYPCKVGDILNCATDVKQVWRYNREFEKTEKTNEWETVIKKYSIR